MHPAALRKGPLFLQKNTTPIFHFFLQKHLSPISFPAYKPAEAYTQTVSARGSRNLTDSAGGQKTGAQTDTCDHPVKYEIISD